MIGSTLENYKVESLLGEGGMGSVYLATDNVLGRKVAIKNLKGHLSGDSSFRERFMNEAKILARLSHPNIALLYNYIQKGEDSYMVMEFVEGRSIDALIKTYGTLPHSLVVPVICQALEGLHHAHSRHVLHRDLKPANIMITDDGHVKIMDFGIARMAGDVLQLTRAKSVIGTLEYIAPELIDGKEPSVASDIYALAVAMYEMLTGVLPFSGSGEYQLMKNIMGGVTKEISKIKQKIPPKLAAILLKAMDKKAAARYPDARSFQKALREFSPEANEVNLGILRISRPTEVHSPPPVVKQTVMASTPETTVRTKLPAFFQDKKNIQYGLAGLVLALVVFSGVVLMRDGAPPVEAEPVTVLSDHREDSGGEAFQSGNEPIVANLPPDLPVSNDQPAEDIVPVPKPEKPSGLKPGTSGSKPVEKRPAPVSAGENKVTTEESKPEEKPPRPVEEPLVTENRTPKPTVSSVRLDKSVVVNLYLEDHLSPENIREGKRITFHVTAPVIYQRETIIPKGAPATAVIRSASSKKISIRFLQVNGVNGQSLDFSSNELSGKISEMLSSRKFSVQLEKGQVVRL